MRAWAGGRAWAGARVRVAGKQRRREKKGEGGRKEKGKGKRKIGGREREHASGIHGRRSRVDDRQPSGAGWDGGQEKERERARFGRWKKGEEKVKRRKKSGVGTAKVFGKVLGFRVN